jgi:hypothetical protein
LATTSGRRCSGLPGDCAAAICIWRSFKIQTPSRVGSTRPGLIEVQVRRLGRRLDQTQKRPNRYRVFEDQLVAWLT